MLSQIWQLAEACQDSSCQTIKAAAKVIDLEQPLTPAHLICGRRLLNLPDAIYFRDIHDDFETTSRGTS